MSRHNPILGVLAIGLAAALLAGCRPQQPFYLHDNGDLSHYRKMATEIEYPNVNVDSLGDVEGATPPMTLNRTEPKEFWDLTLQEVHRHALENSKVMRQLGAAVIAQAGGSGPGTPDFLMRNPQGAPTIYDPAIAESDPRFGVETALAAFDTQLSALMYRTQRNRPNNDTLNSILSPGTISTTQDVIGYFDTDSPTFQAALSKTNAWGGTTSFTHQIAYSYQTLNNERSRNFTSDYVTRVGVEWKQPLLQGAGLEFNQIAGPNGFPGFFQGVTLARVNTDVALATFETNVRNLVSDVENAYWELYFTYRNLDTVQKGLESALQTWQKIRALYDVSAKGGEAERLAQAEEQYFVFRASVERALNSMYKAEANLRYMMGIAAADGRLIRPSDEPTTARVAFDWHVIHSESLVRSVELRQQKWSVKKRELELIASKNFLLPTLDAYARYRWLGLGNDLISNSSAAHEEYAYAYNNMLDGNHNEWTLGLEFSMPLGFRKEMGWVRNAQLAIAKERAILQEQELELSHQLSAALRDLEGNYVLCQTNFNRALAARRNVEAVDAAYKTDTVTIDVLLNAQRLLAQAESEYFRSLVDYTKAITQIHFRKGSLLEYNGVVLAEGPWPAKAYFDATRLARARGAAHYFDYGFTKPGVVSRGVYEQHQGQVQGALPEGAPTTVPGTESAPGTTELVPTPKPSAELPAPPKPLPNGATPKSEPQAAGPSLGAPQAATKQTRDVGQVSAAPRATDAGSVRAVSYVAAAPETPAADASAGWSGTKRTGRSQAPDATPSTAEPDRSAPGWTRTQH